MAESTPIPLFLTCPRCGERHIDVGEFATKPHHTHACQKCGLTWRPAVVPTVGVAFLPGFKNEGQKRTDQQFLVKWLESNNKWGDAASDELLKLIDYGRKTVPSRPGIGLTDEELVVTCAHQAAEKNGNRTCGVCGWFRARLDGVWQPPQANPEKASPRNVVQAAIVEAAFEQVRDYRTCFFCDYGEADHETGGDKDHDEECPFMANGWRDDAQARALAFVGAELGGTEEDRPKSELAYGFDKATDEERARRIVNAARERQNAGGAALDVAHEVFAEIRADLGTGEATCATCGDSGFVGPGQRDVCPVCVQTVDLVATRELGAFLTSEAKDESVGDLLRRAAERMRASKRGEVQAHVKLPEGWAEFTLPEHRPPPAGPVSAETPPHPSRCPHWPGCFGWPECGHEPSRNEATNDLERKDRPPTGLPSGRLEPATAQHVVEAMALQGLILAIEAVASTCTAPDELKEALAHYRNVCAAREDHPVFDAWKSGHDKPLPEDAEIEAAFPTRSERHDLYGKAARMVGARFTKGGLIALVNMLLHRAEKNHGNRS